MVAATSMPDSTWEGVVFTGVSRIPIPDCLWELKAG